MNEEAEEVEEVEQRALVVPAMEVGNVPFQDAFGDVDEDARVFDWCSDKRVNGKDKQGG